MFLAEVLVCYKLLHYTQKPVYWFKIKILTDAITTLNNLKPQEFPNMFVTTWLLSESESHSVVSESLWPHGKYSPWNSPGQNSGVGSLSLLQGIFPTQGLNPGLPHCRWILYQMSPQVYLILTFNFKLNILNTEGIFNFNFQWFFHINIKDFDTYINV